jgi:hypothetical protein
MILRRTPSFTAERSPQGVRITASGNVIPKARVVRLVEDWQNYLQGLTDGSFNAACVLDYGIGVFQRCTRSCCRHRR